MIQKVLNFFRSEKVEAPLRNIEVGVGIAHLYLTDGLIKTITRHGKYEYWPTLGDIVDHGEDLVRNYLKSCRTFVTTDTGEIIPIHRIHSIRIEVQSKYVKGV